MRTSLWQRVETLIIGGRRRLVRWVIDGQARRTAVVIRATTTNGVGPLLFVVVADLILSAYERVKSWVAMS
jgi:hypothetical protein